MCTVSLILGIIVLVYVIHYASVGIKNREYQEFPLRYEELNITETPQEAFSEYYYVGKSYFSMVQFPGTKIYFYKNFLVVNYRGHAQLFEYNKKIMQVKKDIRGNRVSILTDMGEAYFFVNKRQLNTFNSLLEQASI